MRISILVVLILLASPVQAAESSLVDLSGPWESASPEDAAAGRWSMGALPGTQTEVGEEGSSLLHLRRVVEVPPALRDQPLALTVGFGGVSYTVAVDGEKVGGSGRLSAQGGFQRSELVNTVHAVPIESTRDGAIEILLVTEMGVGFPEVRLSRGVRLLGPRELVTVAARESDLIYRTHRVWTYLGLALFLAAVAAWHLALWWRRRQLASYLWYAAYVSGFALFWLSQGLFRAGLWPFGHLQLASFTIAVLALVTTFGVQFCRRFLLGHPPRGAWLSVSRTFLVFAAVAVSGVFAVQVSRLAMVWFACAFSSPLLAALGPAFRKSRDARTIVAGFAVAAAGAASGMILPSRAALSVEMVGMMLPLLIVVSMAKALANRYAHDLEVLDATRLAALRFVPMEFLGVLGRASIETAERGDAVAIEATVMFSDLRGFSALSERLSAEETFALVNRYLGVMQPIIHAHGGVVASYLGDGIMALFPNGPADALRSAIVQIEALERFNADAAEPLEVGIGFHHGSLMLGTLGGPDHLECTLIGDTVNLAARVEGMTKQYGAPVLCTDAVVDAMGEVHELRLTELDLVRAKGKKEPVGLFELVDANRHEVRERKERLAPAFSSALSDYRAGRFERAEAGFTACARLAPDDRAVALFVERCRSLRDTNAARDWDGVWTLTSK
ncbi:MAG: adenylate/guanylate cyclase domain-containing protein [Deltaproteobacteria bacterium]|nr:adenylate/guanylate cyclase domain-containing protein [Deltaproteobacteria bacterium]